jgi:hypothetical protein
MAEIVPDPKLEKIQQRRTQLWAPFVPLLLSDALAKATAQISIRALRPGRLPERFGGERREADSGRCASREKGRGLLA